MFEKKAKSFDLAFFCDPYDTNFKPFSPRFEEISIFLGISCKINFRYMFKIGLMSRRGQNVKKTHSLVKFNFARTFFWNKIWKKGVFLNYFNLQ